MHPNIVFSNLYLLSEIVHCETKCLAYCFMHCFSMWHSFGICGRQERIICRKQHPADPERFLYFLLGLPHLVRYIRNRFVQAGFKLPEGRAYADHLDCARKCDKRHDTTLNMMPHVNRSVVRQNGLKKNEGELCIPPFQ